MNFRKTILTESPTAYWRLGESSGTTGADELGLYPGTYGGTYTLGVSASLAGDNNTAVTFNNGYLSVPNNSAFDFDPTYKPRIGFRIKTTVSADTVVLDKRNAALNTGWAVRINANGTVGFYFASNGWGSSSASGGNGPYVVNDDAWHTVEIYIDYAGGYQAYFYIDGVYQNVINSFSFTPVLPSTDPLIIGADRSLVGGLVTMDEVWVGGGIPPYGPLGTNSDRAQYIHAQSFYTPALITPEWSSRPSSNRVIYLCMDGRPLARNVSSGTFPSTTGGAIPEYGDLSQRELLFKRVEACFKPWDVNITTVDPCYYKGSSTSVFTALVSIGGSNGIPGSTNNSYLASGTSFVFPDGLNEWITACITVHEIGHGLTLRHQSTYSGTTLTSEYSQGDANKAPVMGTAYFSDRALWWKGQTDLGSSNIQDAVEILTTQCTQVTAALGIIRNDSDTCIHDVTGPAIVTITGDDMMLRPSITVKDESDATILTSDTGEQIQVVEIPEGDHTVIITGHGLMADGNGWGGYDIGTYTVEVEDEPDTPITQTFDASNPAIYFLGYFTQNNSGGHNFKATTGNQSRFETDVTASSAEMQLYAGTPYSVTVDGGTPATVTPDGSGWVWATVFTGLSASKHNLRVAGPYFDSDATIRISDSGSISSPIGYGTYTLLNAVDFTSVGKVDGSPATSGLANYPSGLMHYWTCGDAGIRFPAAVTRLGVWSANTGTTLELYRDNVLIETIATSGGSTFDLFMFDTVLDGSQHIYEISGGSTSQPHYIIAIMTAGSTGIGGSPVSTLGTLAAYGTSLIAESSASFTDSRLGDMGSTARVCGLRANRRGNPGQTYSTYLRDNTNQITDQSPAPSVVWVDGPVNDMTFDRTIGNASTSGTFTGDFKTTLVNFSAGLLAGTPLLCRAILPHFDPDRSTYDAAHQVAIAAYNATSPACPAIYVSTTNWIDSTVGVDTSDGTHLNATGSAKVSNRQIPMTLGAIGQPGYTVSISDSSGPIGSLITLTITRVADTTWEIGEIISGSDGASGEFGDFTFTPGQTIATMTYSPAVAGNLTIVLENEMRWVDAEPVEFESTEEEELPVVTTITLSPLTPTVLTNATRQLTASAIDQFGDPITVTYTWSVQSGVGSINSSGLYSAGTVAGSAVIRATNGSVYGQTTITVVDQASQYETVIVIDPIKIINNQGRITVSGGGISYYQNDIPKNIIDANYVKPIRVNRDFTKEEIIIGD